MLNLTKKEVKKEKGVGKRNAYKKKRLKGGRDGVLGKDCHKNWKGGTINALW